MNKGKKAVKTKAETKVKTTTKVVVEPGKRVEETIVVKKKVNPYVDNYSYVETKNILNKNPRFQVIVEHKRKGDIIGGNFEETSYQKQVFSQGGNRPKLQAAEQKLRGNKSENKKPKENKPKEKNPVSASGKKEKIEETTVKRRNEGTGTKTQTKTESKTTSSGLRGQQTTKTSSKTTTTTTKLGGEEKKRGAKK